MFIRSALMVAFQFDPRVNVLIGQNGVGKSAALDRFADEGRRRFSPSTDVSGVRVDWVMEPEGASLGQVRTVYVGPTRAPLTPEMVLSDLQLLDVQGKVAAWRAVDETGPFRGGGPGPWLI